MSQEPRCPKHPELNPVFVLTPQNVHHGKLTCPECQRLITWVKKPGNENRKRRPAQDFLKWDFENEDIDYCQLCLRNASALASHSVLEVHHIIEVQHGGNNERNNRMLLCGVCHRVVHLLRLYSRAPEAVAEQLTPDAEAVPW